jgi:CspA family cold shock protein
MTEQLAAERLMADRVMAMGTVKWFSVQQGYGLISADEGDDDLIVHSTSIVDCLGAMTEGARVVFEVHQGSRGLEAFSVAPLEPCAEAGPRPKKGVGPKTARPSPRH